MARRKKSYNPFKMWGAWIGALVGYIYPLAMDQTNINGADWGVLLTNLFFNEFRNIYVPIIILGFLIGWGIHSLIRRYK